MELDLVKLIETVGYIGLTLIVFAESGLFFGFFFPGDSLLLTSGLLASRGHLNILILIPTLFVAAVLGDNVGYWFGAKTGRRIFSRPNSFLFKQENLMKANALYLKHGGKMVTLARWVPVVRTFAPIVAGAANMQYRRFLSFNVIGAALWAVGMTLLGYFLGRTLGHVEGIDRNFTLLVLAFFIIPGLPTLWHLRKDSRQRIFDYARTKLPGKGLRREMTREPEAECQPLLASTTRSLEALGSKGSVGQDIRAKERASP